MTRKEIKRVYDLTSEVTVLAEKWHELRDDMQGYFDDRSEKWQEGEAGESYQELMEEIEAQADSLDEVAGFEVEL